jgi:acetyl-CoA synthetase
MTDEKKQAISTDSLMDEKRTFPPSKAVVERAYINNAKYKEMYERSINDPDGFWLEQA